MRALWIALTLTLLLPAVAPADLSPASGTFIAEDECPLFQSKKKQTNPGNLKSQPGTSYAIREAIVSGGAPEWLRVTTDASSSPLRWVETSCGRTEDFKASGGGGNNGGGNNGGSGKCNTAGQHDSHVMAISWQPAFCETKSGKTECATLDSARFDSSHFALHGLWPNKDGCGIKYGFCGAVRKRPQGSMCAYPELDLTDEVRQALGVVMPSAEHGTCLQRHEWWKHGTCRDEDPNDYYQLTMRLLEEVNDSAFVQDFVQDHIGQTIRRADLEEAFDAAFGDGAHRRVKLSCKSKMLIEMQLSLPRELAAGATLAELLAAAAPRPGGGCDEFRIDDAPPAPEVGARIVDDAWVAAMLAGDLDAVVACYAEDAVLWGPNAPPAKGREAIRATFAGLLAANTVTGARFVEPHYESLGALSLAWGDFELTQAPKAGGDAVVVTGRYSAVAKKEGGRWVYVMDHASPHPAPPSQP